MVLFADRKKIQLMRGTDAERALHILLEGEVWIVDDGAGNPTGQVYVGDGATLGGVELIRYIGSAFTAAGPTLLSALVTFANNWQMGKSDPLMIVLNSDEEDTDGGRQSTLMVGGERSGGEVVTSASVIVAHDGSSDDDRGRLDVYVNDGDDGLLPTLLAMRLSPDGATFGGEIIGPPMRLIEAWNGSTQLINNAGSPATVALDTTGRVDTGFSLASNEITCSFNGDVELSWHAVPSWTALTRFSALFSVQVDTGGGYATIPACFSRAYLRQSTTGGGCGIAGRVVSVTSGTKFRMRGSAEQSASSMTLPVGGAFLRVRRVGPTS